MSVALTRRWHVDDSMLMCLSQSPKSPNPNLPLPNEDFGRATKPFRKRFRSTFQGCSEMFVRPSKIFVWGAYNCPFCRLIGVSCPHDHLLIGDFGVWSVELTRCWHVDDSMLTCLLLSQDDSMSMCLSNSQGEGMLMIAHVGNNISAKYPRRIL